jgi:hypothetical protein
VHLPYANRQICLGNILPSVFIVRGTKAMIDGDLAAFYEVETKILNQAVKPNITTSDELGVNVRYRG